MVRAEGLEPPRLSPPEPKSGASTNSATPASRRLAWEARRIGRGLYHLAPAAPQKKRRRRPTWISRGKPLVPDQYGDRDGEQAARQNKRGAGVMRLGGEGFPWRQP